MLAKIFYTGLKTAVGTVYLAWGPKGLLFVEFPVSSERVFLRSIKSRFGVKAARDDRSNAAAKAALRCYFDGEKEVFKGLRLDLTTGTPFEQAVWRGLRRIPYGRTWSYGHLARAIDRPNAARAVGRACGRNPLAPIIPCHRVVGSKGELTGYSGKGGLSLKRRLIDMEA
ncbi:MAG: methylated-DNA--[protein]-cysteine S-methyltransferase [Planctomycetota bacterium]